MDDQAFHGSTTIMLPGMQFTIEGATARRRFMRFDFIENFEGSLFLLEGTCKYLSGYKLAVHANPWILPLWGVLYVTLLLTCLQVHLMCVVVLINREIICHYDF